MNESETRAELIDPALAMAGWGVVDRSNVRREYPINLGRLKGSGKRAQPLSADYLLVYKNRKLGIVEAKKRSLSETAGVAQAKNYAEKLQIRFTYSTNGDRIYQIDMQTGREAYVDRYPTPEELWDLTFNESNSWRERFAEIPFEDRGGTFQPRFYQDIAIEKALEAIANNKQRILLTLATGTGKTVIAFQIAWKLFQSRWNLSREPSRRPRILFLADRNILANQAYNGFSAFPSDALERISPEEIRKKGGVPKNASMFFTIFQTFMSGSDGENAEPYFGEYPQDFFDFIIIDECHRGGANDESEWRRILEYFSPAVQLGLTATPKRDVNADTYSYFGDPIYSYSLREGIDDGFLTPFKVKQIATSMESYTLKPSDTVLQGVAKVGETYSQDDLNKNIWVHEREAYRVKVLMDDIDQSQKTLVFCSLQQRALLTRDLINQIKTSSNPNYCVRVTAEDGALGESYLELFQDNEKSIPTILTTSSKLSTGVDARNVRNIVLLKPIKSMIEFKQIIGRGTRLFDDKDYFTIYDYVNAYELFSDPNWDGEPEPCSKCHCIPCECKKEPPQPCLVCGQSPCICVKEVCTECLSDPCICDSVCSDCGQNPCECKKMVRIQLPNGSTRSISHLIATSFWGPDGKPITAKEFLANLFGELPEFFANEDELKEIWSDPHTRQKLLLALDEKGYGLDNLNEIKKVIDAPDTDLYDVLTFIAYDKEPVSREIRVRDHELKIYSGYDDKQKEFIRFVLDQYISQGVEELSEDKLSSLLTLKYQTKHDAVRELGDPSSIRSVFKEFQKNLYV